MSEKSQKLAKLLTLAISDGTPETEGSVAWAKAYQELRRMPVDERLAVFKDSSQSIMPPPEYFQAFLKTKEGQRYVGNALEKIGVSGTVRGFVMGFLRKLV